MLAEIEHKIYLEKKFRKKSIECELSREEALYKITRFRGRLEEYLIKFPFSTNSLFTSSKIISKFSCYAHLENEKGFKFLLELEATPESPYSLAERSEALKNSTININLSPLIDPYSVSSTEQISPLAKLDDLTDIDIKALTLRIEGLEALMANPWTLNAKNY